MVSHPVSAADRGVQECGPEDVEEGGVTLDDLVFTSLSVVISKRTRDQWDPVDSSAGMKRCATSNKT